MPVYIGIPVGVEVGSIGEGSYQETVERFRVNNQLNAWADNCLRAKRFSLTTKGETLSFVKVTPRILGFTENPQRDIFFRKVEQSGLKVCPPDFALYLLDLPLNLGAGHDVHVGMHSISDSYCDPRIFMIVDDLGTLLLSADLGSMGLTCPLDQEWYFILPSET